MTRLTRFDTPANITDFPDDPDKQARLSDAWSQNINRWTETAIIGDPWDVMYDQNRSGYYNPLTTDYPAGLNPVPIHWNGFPARIDYFFSGLSQMERFRMADDGDIPNIPSTGQPYTPAGARGWQDEYCEWSVTRDVNNNITRVDFTCENSEYWFTLWNVDPERVLALYHELVGPQVTMEDLQIKDTNGRPVIDISTGRPAYDPLNRYNNSTSRGAVHLVSGPNTLGAEIYLAAAATLMRDNHDGSDPDSLIQCAKYGRRHRNSDPHIGAQVYGLVRNANLRVTLTNPVGLYMSHVNTEVITHREHRHEVPVHDCWRIVRGQRDPSGQSGSNNKALHVRFEMPPRLASQGLTLSDLKVSGQPLRYGSQLTKSITMMLQGEGFAPDHQTPHPCVRDSADPLPLPLVFLPSWIYRFQYWNRSLQVALTPKVARGSRHYFTIQTAHMRRYGALQFSGSGVTATPLYGQYWHEDGDNQWTIVEVSVAADAPLGDRSLQVQNPGSGRVSPPVPSMLEVVASGAIGAEAAMAEMVQTSPEDLQRALEFATQTKTTRPHRR